MDTGNLLIGGIALTGVVVGLVQVVKPFLTAKLVPVASLGIGTLLGAILGFSQADTGILNGAILGLLAGLSASGAWSGTKAVLKTTEPSQ